MRYALSRAIVRAASVLVPGDRRERWRREWEGELAYRWRRAQSPGPDDGGRPALVARALGAMPHALWLRKETLRLDTLLSDARFALRMMRRQPGFTAVAVVTLALGIGANTAVFTVVNRTLLEPLPYRDPDRLVSVWETVPSQNILQNTPAPATLRLWREGARSADRFAAMTVQYLTLTGGGDPERLLALRASADLLPVTGLAPRLGRNFTADEDRDGGPRAVILTDRFWTRRFARDPQIVGRALRLDGQAATVVGVLPPDVPLTTPDTDVWVPLALTPDEADSQSRMLWVVARLTPGASAGQLQGELHTLLNPPGRDETGIGANVVPIEEDLRGGIRPDLVLMFGVTAVVLLIACGNVATMLLARAAGRHTELSVRFALGAGRTRLVRQLVVESLVLGLTGGAAGFLLAAWLLRLIGALMPATLARVVGVEMDPRVWLFALATAVATALMFGLAPAVGLGRGGAPGLRSGDRTAGAGLARSFRGALVVGQVAMAVVLLGAAGLLIRGFVTVVSTPLGFSPDGVLTFQVYRSDANEATRVAFYEQLLDAVGALPGVQAAGLTNGLPIRFAGGGSGFKLDDADGAERFVNGAHRVVSRDYFRAMGIPLARGDLFTGRERPDSEPVALVGEAFAAKAWPGKDPVGQRFQWGGSGPWFRVMGVVGDVRLTRTTPPVPHVYFAFTQVQVSWMMGDLAVKTSGDPAALAPSIRATVARLDPDQPIADMMTLDEVLAHSLGRRRFTLSLMAGFAALALALCAAGIYGVLSYLVGRRTREIGVRLAVGATAGQVRWEVLRQGVTLATAGALAGTAAAAALARWGAGRVPGLASPDPWTFGAAALLLIAVAAAACDIPARRAMRVDPIRALRAD